MFARRSVRKRLVGITGTLALTVGLALVSTGPAQATSFTQNFDVVPVPGWTQTNLSSPVGSTGWFQGNPAVFPSQAGATNSYIGANFNNTTGDNTISNWLISPSQTTLSSDDTVSFWTRVPTASPFPDRLEVRVSTNGTCSPGATATSVGDFTTLIGSVNPTLAVSGYPDTWTQFTFPLTGVVGSVTGCLAFRYFVTSGGPTGDNSNYIGIDTLSFTDGSVTPDTTPPQTTITSSPAGGIAKSLTVPIGFTSSETPSTFSCKVDTGAAAACTSPNTITVTPGVHTFSVAAKDAANNTDATPATVTFTAYDCPTLNADVAKAQKKVAKAKKALKKAKQSGNAAKIAKAKKKLKKAKKALKAAKAAAAPCGSTPKVVVSGATAARK